jgi:uncharacterized protein YndB with AHSA1/START domain
MTDPIAKSVTVPLNADAAFDLFARQIDRWWPGDRHSVSARSGAMPRRITIEPYTGGAITELTADGKIVIWGRVIAWDPGRYLAFTWRFGRDESDDQTVVAISFVPVGDGTRVDLTQGTPDAVLGDLADAVSTTYLRRWEMVLSCYRACAERKARVHA